MPSTPDPHHRRSIRLPGYDYAQPGAYYVTICTYRRKLLFGEVVEGEMNLSTYGDIVQEEWLRSAQMRREIELDAWVVMPNHFHAVVFIVQTRDDPQSTRRGDRPVAPTTRMLKPGPPRKSLPSLMAGFKSAVTKRINQLRHTPRAPV